MRILEIILVGFISIQIAILILRLFESKKYKWIYPAMCFVVLFLHLFIEGYRWQMIPAYVATLIVTILQLRGKRPKRFGRIIEASLLILLLVFSILLPSVLPVLHFRTSGPYNVGIQNFQLLDESRSEFLTEDPNDFREFSLRVFYPTPSNKKGSYPYMPEYDKIKHTYKKKLGWPTVLTDYLKLFKLEALENAELFEKEKFPLVFYSHGLTNNYSEAQGRLIEIASHGYLVIAINHTYSSDFAILSTGEVVGYKALSRLGDPLEKVDSVKTLIAKQWVDDVNFAKKEIKQTQFSKTIDFNNIGLLGFSAGGTMATLGSYHINNVKVAINLDGTPRGVDISKHSKSTHLFMFSEPQQFSDEQIKAWGITREDIEAPLRLIRERSKAIVAKAPKNSEIHHVPKTKHSNFIEYPLISPLSYYLGIGGEVDSKECYDFINSKILEFLNNHLKKP